MVTAPAALAAVVIAVITHFREHGSEVMSMLQSALPAWQGRPCKSQEVLNAAVWDIRIKQYLVATRVFVHVSALASIVFACGMLVREPWVSPFQVLVCVFNWITHHVVATQTVKMNKITLRLAVIYQYLQVFIFFWSSPADSAAEHGLAVLSNTSGLAIGVLFGDVWVVAPAQTILSLQEIWRLWRHDPNTATASFWCVLIAYGAIVSVTILVDFSTRSKVAMLLNSESMVASFRQMLRGLCDGEILLDGNFHVIGQAECLQRLLMTSEDFGSRSFEELLVEEERPRFLRFMSENTELGAVSEGLTSADTQKSAPPCLRVSLSRGGHRIGVDVFHVKMPHNFGGEPYHLVAFREDFESRAVAMEALDEAAANSSPALEIENGKQTETSDARSCSARSDSSVPQVSSTSLLQLCEELHEMTLLIDASTPLLDVEQAHLSFVRRSDESRSSMPSLRRIVRPTDWGTVRSQLREFALTAGSMASAAQQRDVLKMKLRMQDDANRCIEARAVEVSAFSPPAPTGSNELILKKLCLQISGMKVVTKQKPRCGLQGVEEGQADESEGELSA